MNDEKKTIFQACIFQGWHWFNLGIVMPIFVLFQLERGLSLIQIGFNIAVFSFTVIVLEIPSGMLADYIGHKRTYLLSVILNMAGLLLLALTKDAMWIIFAFVIMGSGRAFSSGSLEAVFINRVSDSRNEKDLEKLISWTQIAIPAGLALGALAGGFLPDLHIIRVAFIPLSDFYSLNFLTVMALGLLLVIFFSLFVKNHVTSGLKNLRQGKENPAKPGGVISLAISTIKSSRVFLIIMITTLGWGLAFSGLETFWQPRVFEITQGVGGTFIYGLLTNGYFLAAALGSLISWPFCRLLGNRPFVFLFFQRLIMGSMLAVLSGISGLGVFSAVYIGLFLFNGTSNPVEQSMLNREIPSDRRATLLSVISFIMQIGGMTGSLIWGFLSEYKGIGFTWRINAGILIISSIAYLWVHQKNKRRV